MHSRYESTSHLKLISLQIDHLAFSSNWSSAFDTCKTAVIYSNAKGNKQIFFPNATEVTKTWLK